MTPERWKQVEDIFQTALDLPSEERAAYLDRACAGDRQLREQVETFLKSYEQAGSFIEAPAFAGVTPTGMSLNVEGLTSPMAGRRVGAYKIEREIGRGGMGAVYLAVRADDEFQRRVAIKLVKRGMDTDFILRRFRHERQILASFDHPNIARLFDGGTTEDGLPYFVMEYIEGQPIHYYCDTHKLSTGERLRLIRQVCSAIHHAHQRHVIHRDIKPGNILVTSAGIPKLLDFGIAKILKPEFTPDTLEPTSVAHRLMTPDYASPEQVRGAPATAASDIYSLGVLLYELLTGHRPYHVRNRLPHEMARIICEEEPERPSVIVGRTEESPSPDGPGQVVITPELVSRNRGATVESLKRELAGDLDNIILKAMSKEPRSRYLTVEELSEDIWRYLDGIPVSAPTVLLSPGRRRAGDTGEVASIAVLPFHTFHTSQSADEQFLGVGMADALITRLSNVKTVTVRPTSSVLKY
ncbi:MAG TPA: serine/threonine-protein kinase, partial [Pyrinomonadaceae bacterium]